MNRLKAFTVIEIITVLLISGIVISLSLSIFLNFEKIFRQLLSDSSKYSEIMFFHRRIKNDFDRAKYITYNQDELVLHNVNNNIVKYNLGNEYLTINTNTNIDTLKVNIKDCSVEYINEESKLITSFFLILKLKGNDFPLFFNKEYSNRILFNNEVNNLYLKD